MSTHKSSWVVGIDVGGTFTDLIMLNADDATVRLAKVPTTMDNQAYGVVAALEAAGAILPDLQVIVHGTTTTTNAILERKVAKVGLITTQGFSRLAGTGPAHPPQALRAHRLVRAAGAARVAPRSARAHGRGGRSGDAAGRCGGEGRGAGVDRQRLRSAGDPFPAQLHQSGARAPRAGHRARPVAQRLPHRRASDPVRIPRIRARHHRLRQCRGAAHTRALYRTPAQRTARQRGSATTCW